MGFEVAISVGLMEKENGPVLAHILKCTLSTSVPFVGPDILPVGGVLEHVWASTTISRWLVPTKVWPLNSSML